MGTPKARRRKKKRFRESLLIKQNSENIQCKVEEVATIEAAKEPVAIEVSETKEIEAPNALKMVEKPSEPEITKVKPRRTRSKTTSTSTTKKKSTRRTKTNSTS